MNNKDYKNILESAKMLIGLNCQHWESNTVGVNATSIVNNSEGWLMNSLACSVSPGVGNAWIKYYDAALPGDVDPATDQPIYQHWFPITASAFFYQQKPIFYVPFYLGLQVRICTGFADTDNTAVASATPILNVALRIKN